MLKIWFYSDMHQIIIIAVWKKTNSSLTKKICFWSWATFFGLRTIWKYAFWEKNFFTEIFLSKHFDVFPPTHVGNRQSPKKISQMSKGRPVDDFRNLKRVIIIRIGWYFCIWKKFTQIAICVNFVLRFEP